MPAVRPTSTSALRHAILRNFDQHGLRLQQRRWARVHDVRFVATHQLHQERIISKYKEKLDRKAREEGHESISSLKEAYREKITEHRRAATTNPKQPAARQAEQQQQSLQWNQPPPLPPITTVEPVSITATAPVSPTPKKSAAPGVKPLSSYLDLDRVASLPGKEIEYIWRLRHANDPLSLCAVIPLDTYNRIYKTARTHPQFILPLPRATAIEANEENAAVPPAERQTAADIHFLQWGFYPPASPPTSSSVRTANTHTSTVLFTHLTAFKLHGEYAPPHTTITHHLDLADSHGLVLLNGSVMEGRGVSVEEGRWLLMCLQKFYDFEGHGGGIGKETRQRLLETFSNGDQEFKLEELVDEAERVS